ncbi:glycosyltransferase family 1 protein [Oceanisphaera sp. IT1-181]|uniref:glycosyltransferase family 1 protein n=1 Tax=Oceanisphaera sp. IT1-181 TaxID=3081199 RepID=UPI0029C9BBB9|nr:glycosyltransferase family 1 protein [Oceanisphaera sp. IT1-181]
MSWLVVQQGDNPSSDYFVKPALASEELKVCDLLSPPEDLSVDTGTDLVFVRYLTPPWKRWVEQNYASLGRLAFFMDDDLFDLSAHAKLPLRYRWKLYRLAWRHQQWLKRLNAELWVSNHWLAEKYQHWQPRVMAPQSPYGGSPLQKTFFYHGSASHGQEIRWLLPVVEEVLQRDPAFSFELFGNTEIRKLFSHLPRVHVLQPMPWSAYKALVGRPGRAIGLAPLLPSSFNLARSATKFFDITQAGAVGIYADHPVYQSIVQHEHNGLLLPLDQKTWADAVLQLGHDEHYRLHMLDRARSYCADS